MKKKRLTQSGISAFGLNIAAPTPPQITADARVAQASDDPLADAAARRFRAGQIVQYGCITYNAHSAGSALEPNLEIRTLLFHDGRQIFDGGPRPYEAKAADDPLKRSFSSAIRLGRALAPGEYVLQLVVRDLNAKDKLGVATQAISFEIITDHP